MEAGEGHRALGREQADHPSGERRGDLGGPEAAVELGEQDVLAAAVTWAGDQADTVPAHRLGVEARRRRRHLDPELDLAAGQVGRPALPEPGDGGQCGHLGGPAAATRLERDVVLLVVAEPRPPAPAVASTTVDTVDRM